MALGLIINPGSTSTKIGVFDGETPVFTTSITHSQEELSAYNTVLEQKAFRTGAVLNAVRNNGVDIDRIEGIMAIGGLLKPCDGGVYAVNDIMTDELAAAKHGEHAANLGALIAAEIGAKLGVEPYIADPITTDEMCDVARFSGMPEIKRNGRCHTLNQKSVAAAAAVSIGKKYEECNLIVVHLGGGISVASHEKGRMTDTNNARGEGPFCIDRTGGLNSFELARLCYSGKYTKEQMLKKINGEGGVVAYLQTRDFREVVSRMEAGDMLAASVFDAMAYQVAKETGAMAAALSGSVDAIVLTGGMAHSKELTQAVEKRVGFIGRVLVFPGERELEALAGYLCEVREGTRTPKKYIAGD